MTSIGNTARVRAIIECERRFFGSRSENPLADDTPGVVVSLKLSEREKGVLLFDPRTCLDAEIMTTEEWREALSVAKIFYVEFYKTCKKTDRNAARTLDPEPIILQTPTPESAKRRRVSLFDNPITDGEGNGAPDEHVAENPGNVGENRENQSQIDENYAVAEFERVIRAYAEYEVPWQTLYPSIPIDKSPDLMRDLMGVDMKVVMDHLNKLNGDNRFGLIPLMCRASVLQLGSLSSQSFSERMNSAGKNVVTKHRGSLKAEMIDKLVCLRMNKSFMQFCRAKKTKGEVIAGISDI
jgi:hypothetical protein